MDFYVTEEDKMREHYTALKYPLPADPGDRLEHLVALVLGMYERTKPREENTETQASRSGDAPKQPTLTQSHYAVMYHVRCGYVSRDRGANLLHGEGSVLSSSIAETLTELKGLGLLVSVWPGWKLTHAGGDRLDEEMARRFELGQVEGDQ